MPHRGIIAYASEARVYNSVSLMATMRRGTDDKSANYIKEDSDYVEMGNESALPKQTRLMSAAVIQDRPTFLRKSEYYGTNERATSSSSLKKPRGSYQNATHSAGSFPKFSLRTQPKSQASTYFSLNNAVRQSSIKLDQKETKAFLLSKMQRQPTGSNSP